MIEPRLIHDDEIDEDTAILMGESFSVDQ